MYVDINEEAFENGKEEAKRQGIEELGEDNCLLFVEDEDIVEVYVDDGEFLHVDSDSKLGFFSIDVPLNHNLLCKIVRLAGERRRELKDAFCEE